MCKVTENFQCQIFLGRRLSEPPQTQLGLTSNWFDQKNYKGRGIPRYFETDQDPNQPRRACVHSLGDLLKLFDRQGLDCYACLVTAFCGERCLFLPLEDGIFSWLWLLPSGQYSTRKIYFKYYILYFDVWSDWKYFSLTIYMTINSFQVHTPFRQAHRGKSCEIDLFIWQISDYVDMLSDSSLTK